MSRHPGPRRLRSWADGRRDGLTPHIDACLTCQERLDEMTRLSPGLRSVLDRVTRPSGGFSERMDLRLEERRREAETWGVVADLFSLPWQVFGAMVDDDGN